MPAVGSGEEAILVLSSHPLWETYKAALLKVADARERFVGVPEGDTELRDVAARDFREALQDCDAVQQRIMTLRRRTWL